MYLMTIQVCLFYHYFICLCLIFVVVPSLYLILAWSTWKATRPPRSQGSIKYSDSDDDAEYV